MQGHLQELELDDQDDLGNMFKFIMTFWDVFVENNRAFAGFETNFWGKLPHWATAI